MGVFIDTLAAPFAGLAHTPVTILTANAHPIKITSIMVTNLDATQPINITLSVVRTGVAPIELKTLTEFDVPAKDTLDVLKGKGMTLEYNTSPAVSDSVVIQSKGYTQKFNCIVNYLLIKELPF